jgi:hypothetical protein
MPVTRRSPPHSLAEPPPPPARGLLRPFTSRPQTQIYPTGGRLSVLSLARGRAGPAPWPEWEGSAGVGGSGSGHGTGG